MIYVDISKTISVRITCTIVPLIILFYFIDVIFIFNRMGVHGRTVARHDIFFIAFDYILQYVLICFIFSGGRELCIKHCRPKTKHSLIRLSAVVSLQHARGGKCRLNIVIFMLVAIEFLWELPLFVFHSYCPEHNVRGSYDRQSPECWWNASSVV